MHGTCRFLNLPHETLIEILSLCSVEDILNLELTCRHVHQVTRSRRLWLSLLKHLPPDQSPNFPPNEEFVSLSTSELKRRITNSVRASRNWRSGTKFQITRDYCLHVDPPIADRTNGWLEPRLLPGCERVVMNNGGRLEIWSVSRSRRLWAYNSSDLLLGNIAIAFDSDVDGTSGDFNIAAVFSNRLSNVVILRVLHYNDRSRRATVTFERVVPSATVLRIVIRGDYLILHLPHSFQLFVMNWKEQKCLVIDLTMLPGRGLNARATLVANTLILSQSITSFALSVLALPLDSLDAPWSTSRRLTEWTQALYEINAYSDTVAFVRLPSLGIFNDPCPLALHAFTPTWRSGALPEIVIAGHARYNRPHGMNAHPRRPGDCLYGWGIGRDGPRRLDRFLSYHLQLSFVPTIIEESTSPTGMNPVRPVLTLINSHSAPASNLPRGANGISNAGHMCALRGDEMTAYSALSSRMQPTGSSWLWPWMVSRGILDNRHVELESAVVAVEPWSGALAVGTPGIVSILHFD